MIKKETIDVILDTARIDEVVSEFVHLKKRGSNLIGLCPFHNEKTPSFNVSPVRGIYKCFGCGRGGNVVNFIMEHEQYSYPEALRFLASKYNITVEEDERSEEYDQNQKQRESLLLATEFARKFYTQQLKESDEGKSIGLSYFYEREFTESVIDKFQLGYAPEQWSAFTDHALENGYVIEVLEKAGLTVVNGDKRFDRFRGRVMFPIHNISGKVIGFGARILKNNEKTAKYLNSSESEIYHKSKILYGIYYAKKSIVAKDECYLVEGYTDVISLHQSGIENVVASSGTALTPDQIRLISRYTKNITILFDGDTAGIKASMRGIDMILEEGLNVKVVLFPDGEDPDSYCRNHNTYETAAYIHENARDFISFKTSLLLQGAENDPVKKAGLIRDIVQTIAKIPDPIIRTTYIKECSVLMEISEQILITELNKILRKNFGRSQTTFNESEIEQPADELLQVDQPVIDPDVSEYQEADIIRLLLNYGNQEIEFVENLSDKDHTIVKETVMSFIIQEIKIDKIQFDHEIYNMMFDEFEKLIVTGQNYEEQIFINHENDEIRKVAADFLTIKYPLAQWGEKGIFVKNETDKLKHAVMSAVYSFKIKKVNKLIKSNRELIKSAAEKGEDIDELISHQMQLDEIKSELSDYLSIVVLK